MRYFKLRNKLFVYNTSCLGRGQRSVIPASLQKRVLLLAHESHAGIVRTKQRLREVAWWPGIDEEVEDFVQSCTACRLSDKSGQTFSMPLQPVQFPDAAWKKLSIDIMGPIENAPPEFRYMVVLTDYYSKWIEISGASRVTTTVVVKIMNKIFTTWGYPEEIVTDNGPQFTSYEFDTYLKQNGIRHQKISVYHPQSNGLVERANRSIKGSIQASLCDAIL